MLQRAATRYCLPERADTIIHMGPAQRLRSVVVLTAATLMVAGPARADDPLDRVSGTESWRGDRHESAAVEWKEWYRARVAWRKHFREFLIQRVRSVRIAALLRSRSRRRPSMATVRRVLSSTATRLPRRRGAGRPSPGQPPRWNPDGTTRAPPSWVKVPVERLDASGQAIDEEGDRELERLYKKKRRR